MNIRKVMILAAFMYLAKGQAQSYEIDPFKFDTINKIDTKGKKQGKWIIYSASRKKANGVAIYATQKGAYVDDFKHGTWEELYYNGFCKSKIDYNIGEPEGRVCLYDEKGTIKESGTWMANHWEGMYKAYYASGKLKFEFLYDNNGQRHGCQKYYYESGKLMRTGNYVGGLEDGYFTDYYEDGKVKSFTLYNKGTIVQPTANAYKAKKSISD
jgi:hypothetical protein